MQHSHVPLSYYPGGISFTIEIVAILPGAGAKIEYLLEQEVLMLGRVAGRIGFGNCHCGSIRKNAER